MSFLVQPDGEELESRLHPRQYGPLLNATEIDEALADSIAAIRWAFVARVSNGDSGTSLPSSFPSLRSLGLQGAIGELAVLNRQLHVYEEQLQHSAVKPLVTELEKLQHEITAEKMKKALLETEIAEMIPKHDKSREVLEQQRDQTRQRIEEATSRHEQLEADARQLQHEVKGMQASFKCMEAERKAKELLRRQSVKRMTACKRSSIGRSLVPDSASEYVTRLTSSIAALSAELTGLTENRSEMLEILREKWLEERKKIEENWPAEQVELRRTITDLSPKAEQLQMEHGEYQQLLTELSTTECPASSRWRRLAEEEEQDPELSGLRLVALRDTLDGCNMTGDVSQNLEDLEQLHSLFQTKRKPYGASKMELAAAKQQLQDMIRERQRLLSGATLSQDAANLKIGIRAAQEELAEFMSESRIKWLAFTVRRLNLWTYFKELTAQYTSVAHAIEKRWIAASRRESALSRQKRQLQHAYDAGKALIVRLEADIKESKANRLKVMTFLEAAFERAMVGSHLKSAHDHMFNIESHAVKRELEADLAAVMGRVTA